MDSKRVERFFEEFDDLGDRVIYSRERDFSINLNDWLSCLERAPDPISSEISRIQNCAEASDLEEKVMTRPGSMVGSGQFRWPNSMDERLCLKLVLSRKLADESIDPMNIAFDYYYIGDSNIDANIGEMGDRLYRPFFSDLRRHLINYLEDLNDTQPEVEENLSSVVVLDRANAESISEKIDEIIELLRQNNQISPIDRERIESELRSGKEIVKSSTVRPAATRATIGGATKWIAEKFASSTVGIVAKELWKYLSDLGLF